MTSLVRADLRRLVESRANRLCEYCLIHESDTYLGCQVDHIISEKHGGSTEHDNLAYACTFCNRAKGTDLGSITASTAEFVRFFNPRTDRWADHFSLNGAVIEPKTSVGEATSRILRFNDTERLLERETLIQIARYPHEDAIALMTRSNPR
jgi:hypothetical protein